MDQVDRAEAVLAEKAADRREAAVPGAKRRHRPGGVLDEERDDGLDVAFFHRSHVAPDELLHRRITRRMQRGLLALARDALADGLASPLQRTVHRCSRRLER